MALRKLLSIVELGGYPNFSRLYGEKGYEVTMVTSVRKALGYLRKDTPDLVVAEYNFQSDFRDRTSNLETLMAPLQRMPDTRLIVFYEKEYVEKFETVRERFTVSAALCYPISHDDLAQYL